MEQDRVIPESHLQIPKALVQETNTNCSPRRSFGNQANMGNREVCVKLEVEGNYDFCCESQRPDNDHSSKAKPIYREVLIDGFSILSFQTENDLLLYSKQKEAERWSFTSANEEITKRPYRHRKERRSKNTAKHLLNCEPVGNQSMADGDTGVASDNLTVDLNSRAFRPSCLTNGSPEVDGRRTLPSVPTPLQPQTATMANGTNSTSSATTVDAYHGRDGVAGAVVGNNELPGEIRNHFLEPIILRLGTSETASSSSLCLEGEAGPHSSPSRTVQCTAFTVTERTSADNDSSNTAGPGYANHNEAGPQRKTPLKMVSKPVGSNGNSLSALLHQTGSTSSANCWKVVSPGINRCWPSYAQGFSCTATCSASSLPVDRPLSLTTVSEPKHDERHRGNREQVAVSMRHTENTSSLNGSPGQCRSFSVAALANELSCSPSQEDTRSTGSGHQSSTPPGGGQVQKSKGLPRSKHQLSSSDMTNGENTSRRSAKRSPVRAHCSKPQSPPTSSSAGDIGQQIGKDRGSTTTQSLSSHLTANALLENSLIAQHLYHQQQQYTPNSYRDRTVVPRVQPMNPYLPQQPMGFPLPLSSHPGPSTASRSFAPTDASLTQAPRKPSIPGFLNHQYQLIHGADADLGQRLSADEYALMLSSLIESNRNHAPPPPTTTSTNTTTTGNREGSRLFKPSLPNLPIPGDGGVTAQKQFTAIPSSSSAAVSLSANASPSFVHTKGGVTSNLSNYVQQPVALVGNRPQSTTVHPISNASPSLHSNAFHGQTRPGHGVGTLSSQQSQELLTAAYCDRKLIDRVAPMLGQTDTFWFPSASHHQFPLVSSGISSAPQLKTMSPRTVAASAQAAIQLTESRGMPPLPLYGWFQRPSEAVTTTVTPTATMSTTMTMHPSVIGCGMSRPAPSGQTLQPHPLQAFSQNQLSCLPYPAVAVGQPGGEIWEAYFRKLISGYSDLSAYNPLPSPSGSQTHLTQSNPTTSMHDPASSSSTNPLPGHSLMQGLLSEHVASSSQRHSFPHHHQPNQHKVQSHPTHGAVAGPVKPQATGVSGGLDGRKASQRNQSLPVSALHRPAYNNKLCGRWADAHIRIARFIHKVQRHHGPGYRDKPEAVACTRPLASNSLRGVAPGQPVRPTARLAHPLHWPGILSTPSLTTQVVPQPAAHLPPQPPTQNQALSSLPSTSASVTPVAQLLPYQQAGSLDQSMNFLNHMFGGLLDQYLARTMSTVSGNDAADMSLWGSNQSQFCQQSLAQPSTSSYLVPGDAINQTALPLFYPSPHQPLNVSMATDTPVNLVSVEAHASNNSTSGKAAVVPGSKRRRMDVPGAGSVFGDTLFNNLLLQQHPQAPDPRLLPGRPSAPTGVSPPKMPTSFAAGILNGFHLPGPGFRHLRPPPGLVGAAAASNPNPLLPVDISRCQLSAIAAAVRGASFHHGIQDNGGAGAGPRQALPPTHLHPQHRQLGVIPPR